MAYYNILRVLNFRKATRKILKTNFLVNILLCKIKRRDSSMVRIHLCTQIESEDLNIEHLLAIILKTLI